MMFIELFTYFNLWIWIGLDLKPLAGYKMRILLSLQWCFTLYDNP